MATEARCVACNKPIEDGGEAHLDDGRVVHLSCLVCSQCQDPVTPSTFGAGGGVCGKCAAASGGSEKKLSKKQRKKQQQQKDAAAAAVEAPKEEVVEQPVRAVGSVEAASPASDQEPEVTVEQPQEALIPAEEHQVVIVAAQAVTAEEEHEPHSPDVDVAESESAVKEDPTPPPPPLPPRESPAPVLPDDPAAPSSEFETIEASPSPPTAAVEEPTAAPAASSPSSPASSSPLHSPRRHHADDAEPSFLSSSPSSPTAAVYSSPVGGFPPSPIRSPTAAPDDISTLRFSSFNQSLLEEDDTSRINTSNLSNGSATAAAADDPVALNALTHAVVRELVFLPQASSSSPGAEGEGAEAVATAPHTWVYPPAHTGVPPVHVSVVDPDNVWTFMERNIADRMQLSRDGGCQRSVFTRSGSLKPHTAQQLVELPLLYLLLIRCETVLSYNTTYRARVRAFVDEMTRTRQNSDFLVVGIESTVESKRVYSELMCVDVAAAVSASAAAVTTSTTRVLAVNISDPHVSPNMEGQWGQLVMRIGQCVQSAVETRLPELEHAIALASPRRHNNSSSAAQVEDFAFLAYVSRVEELAHALLQVDRYEQAGALYRKLQAEFTELKRMGGNAQVERMISRQQMPCGELLFPPLEEDGDGEEDDNRVRAAISPGRVFDVTRLPFAQLITACAVTSVQLELYLFSRIILCDLAQHDAAQAMVTGLDFLRHAQAELAYVYAGDATLIDVWLLSASLEIVGAGHACAAEQPLHPLTRVRLCLFQAVMLERAVACLDRISLRESTAGGSTAAATSRPQLASEMPPGKDKGGVTVPGLPQSLEQALFSSPRAFASIYLRLLEAGAAHFIAGGRFRFAAALTFRRARMLSSVAATATVAADEDEGDSSTTALLHDAARWWSGQKKVLVGDFGLVADNDDGDNGGQSRWHDHWPSLVMEATPGELTLEEMRQVAPRARRLRLAEQLLNNPEAWFPVQVELDATPTAPRLVLHWALEDELRELVKGGGSSVVDKTVLVLQHAVTHERINLLLEGGGGVARRLEPAPSPGEYLPVKAYVWVSGGGGKPRECYVDKSSSAITIPPPPFPLQLELHSSTFLTCGVRTAEQLEANDCIQEVLLTLTAADFTGVVADSARVLLQQQARELLEQPIPAQLVHASPGVVFVQDCFVIPPSPQALPDGGDVVVPFKIKLLVRQKLLPPGCTHGRFTVALHPPPVATTAMTTTTATPHEFAFELPFQFPLRVGHAIAFVPKSDCAALCFQLGVDDDVQCVMRSFSLSSIRPSMIRTTPPNELFPIHIAPHQSVVNLSFLLQELGEIVPPKFAITALFFLSAQVELDVDLGRRRLVVNWSVPLLIERGDVVVTPNWHAATTTGGFVLNTVPPLVSVRLMDREEDLSGVEESTIMIEL